MQGAAEIGPLPPQEPGRAHNAEKPQQLGRAGWWEVALMVWAEIESDRLLLVAAGVAFYVMLSIFPAVTALVWFFGLFADAGDVSRLLGDIAFLLPPGALEIIRGQVDAIASHRSGFSLYAAATLLIALWSANAGMKSMIDAMNLIYDEPERRSFIKLNMHSLLFTLGALAIFLATMGLLVGVPLVLAFVNLGAYFEKMFYYLRWPALLLITILFLTALNRWGPSRHPSKARWAVWGSTLGALMWLAVSLAFSFYVSRIGNLAATYGSLAAIIGLMLWLWLSALVVLVGIELNAELERRTNSWQAEELRRKLAAERAKTEQTRSGLAGLFDKWRLRARGRK
ncbi:MAG: YihY/virulence factor BrkB family protein [Beijerinckiaceae bacterium]